MHPEAIIHSLHSIEYSHMSKLTGFFGAPVTPFKNGQVDYDTLAKQINFLIKQGVSAFAYPMHIGESLNLSPEEFKKTTELLVKTVQDRVPTYINTSSASTDQSIEMTSHCARIGSTGIVLLPPYYWKPARAELIDHFVRTARAHGGQLIAYNNPSATGVSLGIDICEELLDNIPGFIGIKDASFHMETFMGYCRLSEKSQLAIYTGIEYLLSSMPMGGSGCFCACTEVAPVLIRSLYEACASGNYSQAKELQFKVHALLDQLMQSYPSSIKYAMALMQRPVGETRAPIHNLTQAEKNKTQAVLSQLGILDSEPKGW